MNTKDKFSFNHFNLSLEDLLSLFYLFFYKKIINFQSETHSQSSRPMGITMGQTLVFHVILPCTLQFYYWGKKNSCKELEVILAIILDQTHHSTDNTVP